MNLQIHSIKFDATKKLLDLVQKKVDKLETFSDRIIDGEVFLKLNNSGIDNKTVEIILNLPGDQLFSESSSRTFEVAIDEATEALKSQIRKARKKVS
jgi:putative sigma-54 modulation protein